MVRTINFLVQKHTFNEDHNDILGLASDAEAALDIMRGFRRENTSIVAHYEEMAQVKYFRSEAYLKGDGEQFFFSHVDPDEAEGHQRFALKVTVLVVR